MSMEKQKLPTPVARFAARADEEEIANLLRRMHDDLAKAAINRGY
jgi:hypothetical protein